MTARATARRRSSDAGRAALVCLALVAAAAWPFLGAGLTPVNAQVAGATATTHDHAAHPGAHAPAGHDSARPEPAGHDPAGHEGGEGPVLAAGSGAPTSGPSRCAADAPRRHYDVVALAVAITLNRFGDHDPDGRAYVLAADVARVRAEEAAHRAARAGSEPVPVSAGLQGDALQPLTLRVLPGECLSVSLRNDLAEPASFHLHGSALVVTTTGRPALQTEASAVALPGSTVGYTWAVPQAEPEGAHYAHSHGNPRDQTGHGLYGSVVVEPPGSRWLDPRTGLAVGTGWDAVVVRRDGSSFREFAIYYAEVGDETYQPRDRRGGLVPLVDTLTSAYKPGSRVLNYRSEPFNNRLALQRQTTGRIDESAAYSSYAFGDPATPVLRSYVGDPVVQRVVHAGSEALHVHHVHGGSVRWRRQPGTEDPGGASGLTKKPPLVPQASERTDSQSSGPSESYDVVAECGAGGCQQSVGDFLYHCHIAHHYFSGMWGVWRVYGTLQDGPSSTDALPPLLPLPDRQATVSAAVPASQLIGATVDLAGTPTVVTPAILSDWLTRVLPPAGARRGYDAGVWDWVRAGNDVLGEPDDTRSWPGYTSMTPGRRPVVLFDRSNGRPAYPLLRPHLGQRPPFAHGHGPAPYLDPPRGATVPPPGSSGPASLCPTGTKPVALPLKAIQVPVRLSARTGVVDPDGALFVRQDEEAAVRGDPDRRRPLVLRAASQRDCVDVTLLSDLSDATSRHGLSKVNLHVHFMQFDVQGSDGVTAGYNYEQSVRPYATSALRLAEPAVSGQRVLKVIGGRLPRPGEVLALGTDRVAGPEPVQVLRASAGQVVLREPLKGPAQRGELLTAEFVRYRWYPDAQFGTAYFHDHVDALSSWRHGLFGAIVAEPPDATWTDPTTGAPLRSGALADVTTTARTGVDVEGSFREYVALLQDDNPLTSVRRSTGGSLGLRVEALAARGSQGPSKVFSDDGHGPPETAQVKAYLGDPVVFRTLVPGTNEIHTFHVDGHWFRTEGWSATSPPVSAVRMGISERYDVTVPSAGGPQRRAGDYLFGDGRTSKMREGVWGLLRVQQGPTGPGLRPLTGRPPPPAVATGSVCPAGAPQRNIALTAVPASLPMLGGVSGAVYALDAQAAGVQSGAIAPTPLVLHATVGDCLRVRLTNGLNDQRVTLHPDLLAADPTDGAGVAAGAMPDRSVAPGTAATTELYASPEVGETVALLRDQGDPVGGPSRGLYGAVIVAARGARFHDPATGAELTGAVSGAQIVVVPPTGAAYRDAAVFVHDSDGVLGSHQMPYRRSLVGIQGLSYSTAPLRAREEAGTGSDAGSAAVFRSDVHGDPSTPLLVARQGDPLRLHVLAPVSEQAQVFSVDGHRWPVEPGRVGSTLVSSRLVGALETMTIRPIGGAGGEGKATGDFVYGDARTPYTEAGLWGLLRVLPRDARVGPIALACLEPRGCTDPSRVAAAVGGAAGLVLLLCGGTWWWWRRSRAGAAPATGQLAPTT